MPRKPVFDDEEEYIPNLDDGLAMHQDLDLHDLYPRSNAGSKLDWSKLEQQMFDLLLVNRFNTESHDLLNEQSEAVSHLVQTFDEQEIMRICSVAMLAKKLETEEGKKFKDEIEKYFDYIKKHPADVEDNF